jgi:hypothetical protein
VNGRRKKHHAHELGDPYAEGWTAREKWAPGLPKPVNPYLTAAPPSRKRKEDPDRESRTVLETEQWDAGWRDCDEDRERGDLEAITPGDWRRLPPRQRPR